MPFATPEVRASSWADSDYQTRFGELRAGLAESFESSEAAATETAEQLTREVDQLDVEYRIVLMQHEREQRAAHFGVGSGAVNAAFMQMVEEEQQSIGQRFAENEELRAWATMQTGERITGPSPRVEFRTLVTEAVGGASGTNFLLPVGQPYLANVRRQRLFIRDVMAGGTTTLSAVPYVRELNAVSNANTASTVVEATQPVSSAPSKPEAAIQFSNQLAPATVIAITLPVTNQVIQDAPTVMSYINGRLVYMIKYREEQEMLNGNGVWPDLQGLLTAAGIQTQSATSGEFAITLGNAIAKVVLVDGYPNAVALNPADSWAMKTKRAAAGAGTFDAGTPYSSVPDMVWGLPTIETNSLSAGTALVGDYATGAQYFDRQQAGVQIFEQHSDWALKNTSLIRAEERLAQAIYRPDFFVKTTLS